MADEKKKPWQFSLGRMLYVLTLICIILAASRFLSYDPSVVHDHLDAIARRWIAGLVVIVCVVGIGISASGFLAGEKVANEKDVMLTTIKGLAIVGVIGLLFILLMLFIEEGNIF